MSCRLIKSPLTKEEVKSKTWEDLKVLTGSEEEADKLYDQLTSPQFLEWFGDWVNKPGDPSVSKVVNDLGEPMVVYHGTDQDFNEFDPTIVTNGRRFGDGLYFSTDKKAVEKFAGVTENYQDFFTAEELANSIVPSFLSIKNPTTFTVKEHESGDLETLDQVNTVDPDGTIVNNFEEIIATNPNQVKSVFNIGTYLKKKDPKVNYDKGFVLYPGIKDVSSEEWLRISADYRKKGITIGKILDNGFEIRASVNNIYASKRKTEDTSNLGKREDLRMRMKQILDILGVNQEVVDKLFQEQQKINTLKIDLASTENPTDKARIRGEIKALEAEGISEDDVASADILNRIIQFTEDNLTDDNFTEETLHFIVDILEQKNPSLYKQLADRITRFDTYYQVKQDYQSDPNYQTPEGKPDFAKIKKEAITQVLTDFLLNYEENFNETQENQNFIQFIWGKIVNFIKELFGKVPDEVKAQFQFVAEEILRNPEFVTPEDVRYLGTDVFKARKPYSIKGVLSKYRKAIMNQIKTAEVGAAKLVSDAMRVKFKNNEDSRNYFESWRDKVTKTNADDDHYTIAGVFQAVRVTSLLSKVSGSLYKNVTRSQEAEMLREMKAEKGTAIHKDIEDIESRYVDSVTGLRRKKEDIPPRGPSVATDPDLYRKLEDHISKRLASYPNGTRFSFELPVVNLKEGYAGTIDFLAYLPDGSVDILDWKSTDIYYFDEKKGKVLARSDISPFNQKSWKKQLTLYKNALYEQGVNKFRYTRAIPIATEWQKEKIDPTKKWSASNTTFYIKNLEIGDPSIRAITPKKNYLVPVAIETEHRKNKELSELLKKLWGVRDRIEKSTYKENERDKKYLELETISSAIRELQMRGTAFGLAGVFNSNFRRFRALADMEPDFLNEIKPNIPFLDGDTTDKVEQYLEDLENAHEFLSVFTDFSDIIERVYGEDITEDEKDLISDLQKTEEQAIKIRRDIEQRINEAAHKLGQSLSLLDVTSTDLETRFNYFTALLRREEKSLQYVARLLSTVRLIQDSKIRALYAELGKHRDAVVEWSNKTGIGVKEGYQMIREKDSERLLSKVKLEFYDELKEKREQFTEWKAKELQSLKDRGYRGEQLAEKIAAASETYLSTWLKENVDLEYFKAEYEKRYNAYVTNLNERTLDSDEVADLEKKRQLLYWWERQNNILLHPEALRGNNFLLKVKEDKWIAEEYKTLLKPENKALLDLYNYFISLNIRAKKAGMMDDLYNATRFIPQMEKDGIGYASKKTLGVILHPIRTIKYIKSLFLKNIDELANDEGQAIDVDPLSGRQRLYIPVYYKKLGDSPDIQAEDELLRVFAKWAEHIARYETVTEYENRFNIIKTVENLKKDVIRTSFTGKPLNQNEGGELGDATKPLTAQKSVYSTITEDLDKFVNYYVYGAREEVNPVFRKLMDGLYGYTQLKYLSFNISANIANYIGGRVQRGLKVERYANKMDLRVGDLVYAGVLNGEVAKIFGKDKDIRSKSMFLVDYFMTGLDDRRDIEIARQFSADQTFSFRDTALIGFRWTDNLVQKPIAIAAFINTALIDGKLVNIPTYARSLYPQLYSEIESEREEAATKIQEKIEELKKKNIYTLLKKDGDTWKLDGVDISTPEGQANVHSLRKFIQRLEKEALGNMSGSDLSAARMSFWMRPLMQFSTWIPELGAVRFGSMKYNWEGDNPEIPRITALFDTYLNLAWWQSIKLTALTLPLGTIRRKTGILSPTSASNPDIQKAAKLAYNELEQKYRIANEAFPVTEEEFIFNYLDSVDAAFKEMSTIINILLIISMGAFALGSGSDREKWWMKVLAKVAFQLKQELTYFYDPSAQTYKLSHAIPMLGAITDFGLLLWAIKDEFIGAAFSQIPIASIKKKGKKMQKKGKVLYRTIQTIPGVRQANFYLMSASPRWSKKLGAPQPKSSL